MVNLRLGLEPPLKNRYWEVTKLAKKGKKMKKEESEKW